MSPLEPMCRGLAHRYRGHARLVVRWPTGDLRVAQDRCQRIAYRPALFPTCQRVEAGGMQATPSSRRPPLTLALKIPPGRLLQAGGECKRRGKPAFVSKVTQ